MWAAAKGAGAKEQALGMAGTDINITGLNGKRLRPELSRLAPEERPAQA